jgi:hypothetical protein
MLTVVQNLGVNKSSEIKQKKLPFNFISILNKVRIVYKPWKIINTNCIKEKKSFDATSIQVVNLDLLVVGSLTVGKRG